MKPAWNQTQILVWNQSFIYLGFAHSTDSSLLPPKGEGDIDTDTCWRLTESVLSYYGICIKLSDNFFISFQNNVISKDLQILLYITHPLYGRSVGRGRACGLVLRLHCVGVRPRVRNAATAVPRPTSPFLPKEFRKECRKISQSRTNHYFPLFTCMKKKIYFSTEH